MKREDFTSKAKRIVVKVGTSVVTQPDGSFALGRIGYVAEQIAQLQKMGKEVVLVSSGAVGKGAQELSRQALLTLPLSGFLATGSTREQTIMPPRACAAAGQSGMMSLYDDMFKQKGIAISQILLTDNDFRDANIRKHLQETLDILLKWNVVPIINENDVITTRTIPIRDEGGAIFWDNDSLAALIAKEVKANLLIMLSDVEGIYTCHPDDPQSQLISTYKPGMEIVFGAKSRVGRGGMQAKIEAALSAVENFEVPAVVIASGFKRHSIIKVVEGRRVGTLFTKHTEDKATDPICMAAEARSASFLLRTSKPEHRSQILREYAKKLVDQRDSIIAANDLDVKAAIRSGLDASSIARLKLTPNKMETLVSGINQLASSVDPVGCVLDVTELENGLVLEKITTPIGVLLVIFESRPDALPQLVSLAIRSGNALLLKGGKEAALSNKILHQLALDAIQTVNKSASLKIPSTVVGLVQSREDIDELLKLHKDIDLVIPRGSSQLVRYIQKHTKIPVLGHAEGICHIYLHEDALADKAIRIIKDAKLDYPAACNSVETLLLNANIVNSVGKKVLEELVSCKVELFASPRAYPILHNLKIPVKPMEYTFHHEYNDAKLTIAIVDDVNHAISHINNHGSNHTEAIVCEDKSIAELFLNSVDSACVFHNASTRFADGYRFGLGAEVGISNGRIHARGPVGVDGLLTTKWILRSTSSGGHVVSEFTKGEKKFTHKKLARL